MRNGSTAPNVCSIRVRNIKGQTNCFDCELRNVRQNLASIGLLVQPPRELRRIPAPYRSELHGLSSRRTCFSGRAVCGNAAQLRLLQEISREIDLQPDEEHE